MEMIEENMNTAPSRNKVWLTASMRSFNLGEGVWADIHIDHGSGSVLLCTGGRPVELRDPALASVFREMAAAVALNGSASFSEPAEHLDGRPLES